VKFVDVIAIDELELLRNPSSEKICSENVELLMAIVLFTA
jgi:hypothetical protein